MWLSSEELATLTGVKRKRSLQRAWLEKHNYPYSTNSRGQINVLRALVERRHGMKDVADVPRNEPDFSVFERRA